MKVVHNFNYKNKNKDKDKDKNRDRVKYRVTIGNFDGVHNGHRYILDGLGNNEGNNNLKTAVITFEPAPKDYFMSLRQNRITLLRDKLNLFKLYNIDLVWVINFNSNLANLSADDFIKKIFDNLNIEELIIGQDFKFGKNRSGDVKLLESYTDQYNYKLSVISDYKINNTRTSSSIIRDLLANIGLENNNPDNKPGNKLALVKTYLGRYYGFTAKVVRGQQQGRLLGFPTINLHVKPGQIILPKGVYAVNIIYNNQKYPAMANWGMRPTVSKQLELVLEAHIFNFNLDIYDKRVYIEFVQKIRDEQKFNSLEELSAQLARDKETVISLI